MNSKSKLLFYVYCYGFIVISAILGLMINNKTMTINDKILKLSLKIDTLQEENKLLELQVLKMTSLENLESVASSMGLSPSQKIFYLKATHVQ